ncbi:unnamed protein product [Ceutorhynchus assimilis]|uniref:S1 motif domain-containing protein n=1 Tax=Ceutorhynchus assimilis TaxID=467358 RepID=A0A9N9MLK3_9CUCU|nr:unnamed protein product [Ceutorhynchus assimilis]
MLNEILISDDDEPVPPRKNIKTRGKTVKYKPQTSTSDNGVLLEIVTDKEETENFLGEISLLTSDEEGEPSVQKQKKKKSNKKILSFELFTSDEDDAFKTAPKAAKKRKLANHNEATEPKKSKPKQAKATKKKEAPEEVEHLETSNNSLNVSIENSSPMWDESMLLAEKSFIDEDVAKNLIKLWEEGNTIPFIARYRKNVIKDMTPEDLRTVKENYSEICVLKKKMITVAKAVTSLGKLDNKLQGNIFTARTVEELDHIYAPFKTADSKISLAERARKCGLAEPAVHLLNNTSMVNVAEYVNPDVTYLKSPTDVEKGLMHLMASEMARDPEILKELRDLRAKTYFKLSTKKAKVVQKKETKTIKSQKDETKFENYYDFSITTCNLKAHQILAINRGEAQKLLSVKIEIPEFVEKQFKYFCNKKWTFKSQYDTQRQELIGAAINDAYQRLISPLITREIRADLKLKAVKESCKIFSDNLKHMLLLPPVKGKAILGIDPGYSNGCKLALISPTGTLLAQSVVYPHTSKNQFRGENVIKDMLVQNNCNLIVIGNGTACRQTEEWISGLIKTKYFGNINVQYSIVNEDGASIYSCSPEAKKEFGMLDPNIISAVSLARRIQDPMAELVKVEPCHLGIGMYQLDIKKKELEEALSEVVSECVSFVGVDLNTVSQCLLRRVAGLSDKRATQIIDYRERNGPFINRKQLLNIYGIGDRTYEQCIGFLRVCPTNPYDKNFYTKKETTVLDATIIHPESYSIVRQLLGKLKLQEKDIGTESFIRNFKFRSQDCNIDELANSFKTDKPTMKLIIDALSKPLNHDLRTEISQTPLFKTGITTMEDLEIGALLTGRVKNVTSFGAFVDCGVERDGLIHVKAMRGLVLHLGDVVEVRVRQVDLSKGHIQLDAVRKMN